MERIALVVGATGLVGSACVAQLLASEKYSKVLVVARRQSDTKHAKLQTIIANFEQLDQVAEQLKAHDVYYCLGTTIKKAGSQDMFRKIDYDYTLSIAKIALENRAEQFLLVSSLGADAKSSIFYSKVKGELENALKKMPFAALHIFQPSILLGDRNEQRPGEAIGQRVAVWLAPLMVGALKKYRGIKGTDVAKSMLNTALQNKKGIYTYLSDEIQVIADK